MLRVWLTVIFFLAITSFGHGEDWAKDMFKETSFDFGVVARGAKAEHRFVFENIYIEDAHISSVRSSCGCTTPESPTGIIKTYEQAAVIAKIDTRSFLGSKNATITVVFDKPFYATVDLHVYCYIRSDVVFQPGVIQFGTVRRGKSEQRKTTISYAGSDNWQITSVSCANPFLKTDLVEASRFQGRTTYDLWVTLLPKAQAGYINDQIFLHTNDSDPAKSKIPLSVEGVVVDALTARPSPLTFGILSPDKPNTKNLVIRGHIPFRVKSITCPNEAISFDTPTEVKRFHIVPITLLSPSKPDKINTKIKIETDIPNTPPIEVPVYAEIVAEKCDANKSSTGAAPPSTSDSEKKSSEK
ncbi:MAG: DUF1573 domain-containing protein [Pirellulales bacterium]|nr:DUF1573 domain-containing protein [Pirellulales bacterium]